MSFGPKPETPQERRDVTPRVVAFAALLAGAAVVTAYAELPKPPAETPEIADAEGSSRPRIGVVGRSDPALAPPRSPGDPPLPALQVDAFALTLECETELGCGEPAAGRLTKAIAYAPKTSPPR